MTLKAVASRLLAYFDAVDKAGGRAPQYPDLYDIPRNQENLNIWVTRMCDEWKVLSKETIDGKVYFKKTPLGDAWHLILKSRADPLIEELNRNKLRSSSWYTIPKLPFDEEDGTLDQ